MAKTYFKMPFYMRGCCYNNYIYYELNSITLEELFEKKKDVNAKIRCELSMARRNRKLILDIVKIEPKDGIILDYNDLKEMGWHTKI